MSSEGIFIRFEGATYRPNAGESVLDCLLRHGVALESHCRSGVCQSCKLRAREPSRKDVPARAQSGLRESERRGGALLACVCFPTASLELERTESAPRYTTRVVSVEQVGRAVLRVELERPEGFEYQAGQFIQLERLDEPVMRPYSLASLPSDPTLVLHVAVLPNGRMSGWLAGAAGRSLAFRGPLGECCYVEGEPERPLLLAGTGTGLAPLLGVARAAERAGHRGPVALFHGARDPSGLYGVDELAALRRRMPNLRAACVVLEGPPSAGDEPRGIGERCELWVGALDRILFSEYSKLDDYRLFFCGSPELVALLKKRAYLAGASLSRIHSDPFLPPVTKDA